jgi:hypothetical protein
VAKLTVTPLPALSSTAVDQLLLASDVPLTSPNHSLNGTTTGVSDSLNTDPLHIGEVVIQSCLPPSSSSTAVDQPLLALDVSLTSLSHPLNGTTTGMLDSSHADPSRVREVVTPSCLLPALSSATADQPLLALDVYLTSPNHPLNGIAANISTSTVHLRLVLSPADNNPIRSPYKQKVSQMIPLDVDMFLQTWNVKDLPHVYYCNALNVIHVAPPSLSFLSLQELDSVGKMEDVMGS